MQGTSVVRWAGCGNNAGAALREVQQAVLQSSWNLGIPSMLSSLMMLGEIMRDDGRSAETRRRWRTSSREPGRRRTTNREEGCMRIGQVLKCAVVVLLCCSGMAAAQSFPTGPLRLIVPFPPGGGTDTLARVLADQLRSGLGQPVIVENRGGANGTIGTALAARAAPDGYTMLMVPSGFAANGSIYRNLPYDSVRDFSPVSLLATNPSVLTVHPSLPVKSVKELIAFLKAHPDEVDYASSGIGSPPNLMTELFKLMTHTRMTHVPYKGGGPATVAVVSGEVAVYIMSPLQAWPQVRAGRVRALAVTGTDRERAYPDLPTIAEAGVPGYAMANWYGLLVPAGSPAAAVNRLHSEVARVLKLPDVKSLLEKQGATVVGVGPKEFAAFLKDEFAKAARVAKAAGITVNN